MGARATAARTTQLGRSLSQVSPAFLEAMGAEIAGLACGCERRSASLAGKGGRALFEKGAQALGVVGVLGGLFL